MRIPTRKYREPHTAQTHPQLFYRNKKEKIKQKYFTDD